MSLDVYLKVTKPCEVYTGNVTGNLYQMALAAGIADHLWQPESIGITKAFQLIEPLQKCLKTLREDKERFERLNPPNGWGSYLSFINFLRNYLNACEDNPNADVEVSA